MRYVSQPSVTADRCRPAQVRNPLPPWLVWSVLFVLMGVSGQIKAQTAPASITVSGACLSGTYVLNKFADDYQSTGKPAYAGTGEVSIGGTSYPNVPLAVYFEPTGPAWLMTFDGQPYLSNLSTSVSPPVSGWVAVTSGVVGLCEGGSPLTLLVPTGAVSITSAVAGPVCAGSTVSLTATATNLASPVTYNWSSLPSGFAGSGAILSQNAPSVGLSTQFVISVTATSGESTATASVSVTVEPSPGLVVGVASNPTTCVGSDGSIAFTTTNLPDGIYSLTYTGAGSPRNVSVIGNSFVLADLPAGVYSNFSITMNGCSGSAPTSVTLSDPEAPLASLNSSGPLSCAISSVTLTASGGVSYAFSAGATQIGGSIGNTATVSSIGTYSVIVTSANGCTASAQTTVIEDVAGGQVTYYADQDGDGFGNPNSTTTVCSQTVPPGYVTNNADCDDTTLMYADQDGDGLGSGPPVACGVSNNTDCNDNDNTNAPTNITSQPVSLTIDPKESARFSVAATGSNLTYQWYFSGNNNAQARELKKETSATLAINKANSSDAGSYFVRVTGGCGSVLSSEAILTVSGKKNRLAAPEPASPFRVTVMGNPLVGSQLVVTVTGAAGTPLQLEVLDLSGRVITHQRIEQVGAVETRRLEIGPRPASLLLLRVSTATQSEVVKVITQ